MITVIAFTAPEFGVLRRCLGKLPLVQVRDLIDALEDCRDAQVPVELVAAISNLLDQQPHDAAIDAVRIIDHAIAGDRWVTFVESLDDVMALLGLD